MRFGKAFRTIKISLTPDEMQLFAHRAAHSGRHVTHFVQDAALAYLAQPPERFAPALVAEATERVAASLPRATIQGFTKMAGDCGQVSLLLRDAVLRYLGLPKDHPAAYRDRCRDTRENSG